MIPRADVGCWVVRADPSACGYPDAADGSGSWRLGRTYRNRLVAPGDRLAVLLSGSRVPGVHGVGRVTGPARAAEGVEGVEVLDLETVRLAERFVTRAELRADPVLAGAEPLRVPVMSNPSYLDVAQTARLAELLGDRMHPDELRDAGWSAPPGGPLGRPHPPATAG